MKKRKLILIGASTGGPGHLEKIISSLSEDFSATIIIAQHMDSIFIPSMVNRFNNICKLDVIQAHENDEIDNKSIVFTHKDITQLSFNTNHGLHLQKCDTHSNYFPSVNSLFHSAAKLNNVEILACLLTGIGDDGANGMLELKKAGALCVSESEQSAIIYGMPKAANDIGASSRVLHIDDIIKLINSF